MAIFFVSKSNRSIGEPGGLNPIQWEKFHQHNSLKSKKSSAKSLGCFPSWGMAAWAVFDSLAMKFLACCCLQQLR